MRGGGRTDKALNELREAEANSIEDSNVLTKLITQDLNKNSLLVKNSVEPKLGTEIFVTFSIDLH